MKDRFSTVRWLAFFVYFAGLVFVIATKNVRVETWFGLTGSFLLCFDGFALPTYQKYSLLGARDEAKPKFRPSALMAIGFALFLTSWVYFSHIRLSAALMMAGLCLLVLDRNTKTSSIFANR